MLPRVARFDRTTFAQALRAGRRTHTPFFSLVKSPAPNFRVAVVVGKKVAKQSVARNRLRRRLYAAFAHVEPAPGHYILIAKAGSAALPYGALEVEIARILSLSMRAHVGASRLAR